MFLFLNEMKLTIYLKLDLATYLNWSPLQSKYQTSFANAKPACQCKALRNCCFGLSQIAFSNIFLIHYSPTNSHTFCIFEQKVSKNQF